MAYPEELPDDDEGMTEALNPRERAMGFFDHLEELRWTLVKCVLVFVVIAGAIGLFLKEFNEALLWPLRHVQGDYPGFAVDLGTTSVMEAFTVVIQMCLMGGLVLGAPLMFYFVGRFIAPALNEKETKLVLPGCIAAFLLFMVGASFSFFLLVPGAIRVSIELNELFGFVLRWTPAAYYSLLTWLVLGVGASFEFPLFLLLAVFLGVLTVATLRRFRKHAVIVFFVVAAIVTPTPDPITQTSLAVPLYLLYEAAIFIGARVERKRERDLADAV